MKVLIVDDHSIFRKGLIMLLEEVDGVEVIGEVGSGREFLAELDVYIPDIVLMDVQMPGMSGIDASNIALYRFPNLKIIALSMFDDEDQVKQMLEVGAKGFLLKNINKDELAKSLQVVKAGGIYYSKDLSNYFLDNFVTRNARKQEEDAAAKLTRREIVIIKMLCQEMTNHDIAEKLYISERTVQGHRANIMAKIKVANTVGIVKFALRHKLIAFDEI